MLVGGVILREDGNYERVTMNDDYYDLLVIDLRQIPFFCPVCGEPLEDTNECLDCDIDWSRDEFEKAVSYLKNKFGD